MAIKRNQVCSVRNFELGCIEKFTGNGRASIVREHGVYVVRGFKASGKHVVESTRKLGKARQIARTTAK